MTIRVFLQGERVGPKLTRSASRDVKQVLAARRGAAEDVVDYVVPKARSDIKSAGNFGARWTSGFDGRITEGGGFIKITFTNEVPYWRVFEYGATIHGRPLLWIPLPFAKDAVGKRARDYPGRLFRVDRAGGKAPLLMAPGGAGRPAEAKYFGKASVRIPKKFHLREIIREGARKMKGFYGARIRTTRNG